MPLEQQLVEDLHAAGQGHLVAHAAALSISQRTAFAAQLQSVNWPELSRWQHPDSHAAVIDPREIEPPAQLIRRTQEGTDDERWQAARARGEAALASGTVASIVVAGGQGTRLGFDAPKGFFPIGPVTGATLFQGFFEQLEVVRRQTGRTVPLLVMTSDATHNETVEGLRRHAWFGRSPDDVWLFCQGNMPALDAVTGRALLSGPGQLALSPDGHGGMLAALQRGGLLQRCAQAGIETFFYHQVDNPATIVCDPAFLGWHLRERAEVSTKVVPKRAAEEKMGVAVTVQGTTRIIEYSDLPPAVATATDDRGRLRIWAGNTAIHAFDRQFLERAAQNSAALPFHRAQKVVPYWTAETGPVVPTAPNAIKLERFIFDLLPTAERALIVETQRDLEFLPVKNAQPPDAPESVRAALQQRWRTWLRAAGAEIADDVPVEISPLVAFSAADLPGRLRPGTRFTETVVLDPVHIQRAAWFVSPETA
jgi:UDP-N-acetylglucosamine/UDP-N-acetylgalactosamine diphosphorylase